MDPPHNFQSTVESGSGNSTPCNARKRHLLNSWTNRATERANDSGSQGRLDVSEHGREPMQTSQMWGWATEPRALTHPQNTAPSTGSFQDGSETRGSQGFDLELGTSYQAQQLGTTHQAQQLGAAHQAQQLGTAYQPQYRMQQGWPGNPYYGNDHIGATTGLIPTYAGPPNSGYSSYGSTQVVHPLGYVLAPNMHAGGWHSQNVVAGHSVLKDTTYGDGVGSAPDSDQNNPGGNKIRGLDQEEPAGVTEGENAVISVKKAEEVRKIAVAWIKMVDYIAKDTHFSPQDALVKEETDNMRQALRDGWAWDNSGDKIMGAKIATSVVAKHSRLCRHERLIHLWKQMSLMVKELAILSTMINSDDPPDKMLSFPILARHMASRNSDKVKLGRADLELFNQTHSADKLMLTRATQSILDEYFSL
ncbi:hypothetical protein PV10_07008 [Exophiala mesophila]|uniref:Uncharacterized protein n=1 Tax=Exophiala mesophila TaxID=212818 RepID=A0A0D1Z4C4_EXOME|nr:uncharacterized protein PV10_07008 [Exophiala mesophila]KIV89622.1 hypothetical protein PV10_07008 [Exophiala mesophila]